MNLPSILDYWKSELLRRPDLHHYSSHCKERIKEITLLLENKEE